MTETELNTLANISNTIGLLHREKEIPRGARETIHSCYVALSRIVEDNGRKPITLPLRLKGNTLHEWPENSTEKWAALK